MPPSTLSFKTENIEIPTTAVSYPLETDSGVIIEVTSTCLGKSRRLANDFSIALEYGAGPGLQARIIQEIHASEEKGLPLHCLLSFGV